MYEHKSFHFAPPVSFDTSVENLYYALAAHCSPPDYDVSQVLGVFKGQPFKVNMSNLDHISTDEYLSRFPTNRQAMLRAALDRGVRDPYHYAFVKKDKLLVEDYKVPRVVLASSDETIANFGAWYMAYSRVIKKTYSRIRSPEFLATGVSGEQVGAWFNYWYKLITPEYYVVTDFSKMDRSENVLNLMWEWDQYFESMDKNQKRKYWPYYLDQLVVYIRGMAGSGGAVRLGGKNSGCLNTCIGNSIQHMQLLRVFFKRLGWVLGIDCAYLILGDDLLLMSKKAFPLKEYNQYCILLGFNVKASQSKDLSKVDFCQKIFFPTTDGFMPGPKVGRYLSKIGYSFKSDYDYLSSVFSEDLAHVPTLSSLEGVRSGKVFMDWELHNEKLHEKTFETDEFFVRRYGFNAPSSLAELTQEQISIIDMVDNSRNGHSNIDEISRQAEERFLKEGGVHLKYRPKLQKVAVFLISKLRDKFQPFMVSRSHRLTLTRCLEHLDQSLKRK